MHLRSTLICASILACCLLASCSSSTGDSTNTVTFTGTWFTILVPKTWTAVDSKALPNPANGTIVLALTSPEIAAWFANNMSVLQDTLHEAISSLQYSIVNYTLSTGAYAEYTKLAEKKITFSDKDEANLYIFEAKYNKETPKEKFVQTAKVCGDKAYLMTVAIGYDTTSTTKYENLLTSFTCQSVAKK